MKAKAPLLCTSLLLSLFSACGTTPLITDLVVINYTQEANTDEVTAVTKLTDGMFLRYHFDLITNTDSHPQDFHFDPGKVFVLDQLPPPPPGGKRIDAFPMKNACFPHDATAVTVPAGGTTKNEELFGVTIRVHGDPASLQTQFFALNYQSAAGEHVVMATPNLTQGTPVQWLPKACKG